jgi:hypothetical protein
MLKELIQFCQDCIKKNNPLSNRSMNLETFEDNEKSIERHLPLSRTE